MPVNVSDVHAAVRIILEDLGRRESILQGAVNYCKQALVWKGDDLRIMCHYILVESVGWNDHPESERVKQVLRDYNRSED